ncbi:MAG: hypothetical protein ACXVJ7_11210 [Acidimicrobiia bacterium]
MGDDGEPTLAEAIDVDDLGRIGTGPSGRRRATGVAGIVVVLALVAVAFGLRGSDDHAAKAKVVTDPNAAKAVTAAAAATAASGGWDFTTEETLTAPPSSTQQCRAVNTRLAHGEGPTVTTSVGGERVASSGAEVCDASVGSVQALTLTGRGTINVSPYSMVSYSRLSTLGDITVRTDGTSIWEHGGADYGLAPDGTEGAGRPLSGFAELVEGSLGRGAGANTMVTLANPMGWLSLEAQALSSAVPGGTGTVDGVAVTYYDVTIDQNRMGDFTNLGAEQQKTIRGALAVLAQTGYDHGSVRVGIDADGYVKETITEAFWHDGGSMRTRTVFAHFGCVGRVLMPGQAGDGTPAPGADCISPTTTTLPAASTTTLVGGSSTTRVAPVPDSTSSTTSSSTTTTTAP